MKNRKGGGERGGWLGRTQIPAGFQPVAQAIPYITAGHGSSGGRRAFTALLHGYLSCREYGAYRGATGATRAPSAKGVLYRWFWS
jgi:hypothetical protein